MNKLDVAIKLLRLLNERKELDSKTVADELHVSLRTAQRYLMELSAMPCVINGRTNNTYTLNEDYQIKKAIVTIAKADVPEKLAIEKTSLTSQSKSLCLYCGNARNYFCGTFWTNDNRPVSNKDKIDKLASIIKHRLKSNTCSFP
jgi:hypothetical protein